MELWDVTEYSTSMPVEGSSAFSSMAVRSVLRYWSEISWYSESEMLAAEALEVVELVGSVFGGAGSAESGVRPFLGMWLEENDCCSCG